MYKGSHVCCVCTKSRKSQIGSSPYCRCNRKDCTIVYDNERTDQFFKKLGCDKSKNASSEPNNEEQKKEMPVLLTRPELELERSFDIKRMETDKE